MPVSKFPSDSIKRLVLKLPEEHEPTVILEPDPDPDPFQDLSKNMDEVYHWVENCANPNARAAALVALLDQLPDHIGNT